VNEATNAQTAHQEWWLDECALLVLVDFDIYNEVTCVDLNIH